MGPVPLYRISNGRPAQREVLEVVRKISVVL